MWNGPEGPFQISRHHPSPPAMSPLQGQTFHYTKSIKATRFETLRPVLTWQSNVIEPLGVILVAYNIKTGHG